MPHYIISASKPHRHYIDIEARFETGGEDAVRLQLPAWRPGRYELANFAQNIQRWQVSDEKGNSLTNKKITKDLWEVQTGGATEVVVKYNYYANQLDAGASYFDEQQLYVNPVNCLLYEPGKLDEECTIKLTLPEGYQIASALRFNEENEARADSFHTLADSPFIASPSLKHDSYSVGDYTFHIWIQGECLPDWVRIKHDFSRFTQAQLALFGELPMKEYHFLFQIPAFKFYHGVEHLDSTVICLGPGYKLNEHEMYTDFVGISSHELFHSWNIKSIRPAEMMPYDYSKENYTNLGYVAEGVTTYYGDLLLFRSGVYSWETYALEVQNFMHRHFHVFGRFYQTLAESSFDTWLDGYKPGAPDRKVNMYVKGMLLAMILDISIRKDSGGSNSLDDVMRTLYRDFGKMKKGYTEEDYLAAANNAGGQDYRPFFEKYVWGLEPIEPALKEALQRIGCHLHLTQAEKLLERHFGIRLKEDNTVKSIIAQVAPCSPGDEAGISIGDEIIALNGVQVDDKNLEGLLKLHEGEEIRIELLRSQRVILTSLKPGTADFFPRYHVVKRPDATDEEIKFFEAWAGQTF